MNTIHTHYDNLKVARDAPIEVIRAAYKSLSQKYHPDKNPNDPKASHIMSIINTSYDVLSDPIKKHEYDLWLADQESPQEPLYAQPANANITPELRPWSRYFAKFLDGIIGFLIAAVFFALFTYSSDDAWLRIVALCLAVLLFVWLEAIQISKFGTTLGKAILGITVAKENGTLLSFDESLKRTFLSYLRSGMGLPLISIFMHIYQYNELMKNGVTSWDRELKVLVKCSKVGLWRWVMVVPVCLLAWVVVSIGGKTINNSDITVAQQSSQTVRTTTNQNPKTTPIVRVDDIPQTSGVPSQAIQKEADKLTQEFIDGTQGMDAVVKQQALDQTLNQMRQLHGKEVADIFYKQAYADTLRQSNTLPNSQFSQEQCTQKLKDFGYYLKISQECQFEKHKSDYDLKKLNQGCNKSKDEIETILKTLFNTINAKQAQQGKSAFCASEWEYYNKLDTQP